jgi:signal transduction histidine kinase
MGMGLMICRSVIEAHDGRITVKARDDAPGTRFVFTLPARAS